jgi:CheY-like chemotaxis protein
VDEHAPQLLVIEDARDQAVLVGVAARMALPGLEVHIAGDGQEGIDYLSGAATPDLVILDLMMPVVDGFGVLEWLAENLDPVPFPVVVLSGSIDPEHEARARALGASAVFEKPKSLDGLGTTVRSIVTRFISAGDIMAAHIRQSG